MNAPSENASAPIIELRALTRRFGDFVAVDAVDLSIAEGELFGLLGPNGAGKTTLLRMLIALLPISSGQAVVAGVDVGRHPQKARQLLGVIPQALTSDLDLTGWENLDIYARFFSVPRNERLPRMEELLRKVSLWERRDDLVKTYSGGMRRRLEIARGLVHRPRVLVLDEPTIGLDPQSRLVIWDLLRELRGRGDLTIVLTTHYLDEAEALCDRVAIVDRGRIVVLGTPAELKARVPGSDTIEFMFSAPPSPEVLDELRAMPNVRKLEPISGGVRIRADKGGELLPALVIALEHRSVRVTSATLSRITLEDVFIHVTGRSLREESSAHAASIPVLQRRFT